jgi:uncharacterized membrane protein
MSPARDTIAVAARSELERQQAGVTDHAEADRWRRETRLDVGLRQSSYTSPLPAPDDLDRYVAQLPDAAERLLAVGEREQAHRHAIEDRLAAIDEQAMPRLYASQRFAHAVSLILGLTYLGAMVVAILDGYPMAGVGGATFGIAAVIWAIRRDPSPSEAPPYADPRSTQFADLSDAYADAFEEQASGDAYRTAPDARP